MILYPAVDLMGGHCVRLRQGDFARATHYPAEPAAALRTFAAAGAGWAHVVDLDGARQGGPAQHALIAALARAAPLRLQVAGGFRTAAQVETMLGAGVGRVVIGSLALQQPDLAVELFERFGAERMTLALDVRLEAGRALVAAAGWAETSAVTLAQLLGRFPLARHLLVTDIARDGMLAGPNFGLMEELVRDFPTRRVQASGGVAALADLDRLEQLGVAGTIVGKALWEGRFTLEEALADGRA